MQFAIVGPAKLMQELREREALRQRARRLRIEVEVRMAALDRKIDRALMPKRHNGVGVEHSDGTPGFDVHCLSCRYNDGRPHAHCRDCVEHRDGDGLPPGVLHGRRSGQFLAGPGEICELEYASLPGSRILGVR